MTWWRVKSLRVNYFKNNRERASEITNTGMGQVKIWGSKTVTQKNEVIPKEWKPISFPYGRVEDIKSKG